jgi:hypothetical protein
MRHRMTETLSKSGCVAQQISQVVEECAGDFFHIGIA